MNMGKKKKENEVFWQYAINSNQSVNNTCQLYLNISKEIPKISLLEPTTTLYSAYFERTISNIYKKL